MSAEQAIDRSVLRITGDERVRFLQDLVSNDIAHLAQGPVYAALLSPQGKYLFDFFLIEQGNAILIDVASGRATALAQRLNMYRLRAKVDISATDIVVSRGLGAPPFGAMADPRHDALGWRLYGDTATLSDTPDWTALRVRHMIPETGIELIPDDSYILEMGFERLHGVDFRKGCYVGQEVTARMKHKTTLRKGLARVTISGEAPTNSEITARGKVIGKVLTRAGNEALAYVRFDQAKDTMQAAGATVTLID